jgi:hypothetical protein
MPLFRNIGQQKVTGRTKRVIAFAVLEKQKILESIGARRRLVEPEKVRPVDCTVHFRACVKRYFQHLIHASNSRFRRQSHTVLPSEFETIVLAKAYLTIAIFTTAVRDLNSLAP